MRVINLENADIFADENEVSDTDSVWNAANLRDEMDDNKHMDQFVGCSDCNYDYNFGTGSHVFCENCDPWLNSSKIKKYALSA